MINLTINAHDGHLYEITSRYNQPQASAARIHRADAFTTQSLIARLSIEPDTWVQILARINNRPTALRSYHAGAVHQEVAQAVMRGDLNLYQLPLLNSARCLRGKKDTGLCIIQGPKPHSATELSPVAISTPQAAQALLDELGITASALLAYLDSNGIYNSYDQNKPLDEVLNRLASQKLLAYKIPLPPASAPKKSVEYIPAAGPGYDAVPLAPETKPTPVVATTSTTPPAKKINPELEARAQELEKIGTDLRTNGFTPTSDEEVMQAVNTGDLGNRRFLVSIQKTKSNDAPVGYTRKDTGRTTMWTTTYDMLKKGDTSAPLLMSLLGSTYEPGSQYTMYILDQGENFGKDGALTFVPTWENMQKYCPQELHMDNPEDPIYDEALLASVMNPETQVMYKQTMEDFWNHAEGTGMSEYESADINEYLVQQGFSPEERTAFRSRHLYRTQVGANAYFLGTGATEFTLHDNNKSAIASDNIKLNGAPGKVGVPEMLTIEKDPPSIALLEQQGLLKAIPLKGISA